MIRGPLQVVVVRTAVVVVLIALVAVPAKPAAARVGPAGKHRAPGVADVELAETLGKGEVAVAVAGAENPCWWLVVVAAAAWLVGAATFGRCVVEASAADDAWVELLDL